mgnify:CR=1 FL=1
MSNLFKNMTTTGLEESQDRLGGGYQTLETDIYVGTFKALYAGESKGGAISLNLVADLGNGREYKETLWITNKQKQNFFVNKDSGKKSPLPGFTVANDLCLIATDKELSDLETEEKVVKIYDYEAKKELPQAVQMVTEALGKKVALGIVKTIENKTEKVGDEYVPTAETREVNSIDKVFHPEAKVTVAEARQGKTEGEFWDAWSKRNKGQTRDKRSIKDEAGGAAGGTGSAPPKAGGKPTSGSPAGAGKPAAPKKSLFSK